MANCIRCGMEAATYGTDGLPYCDSCSFYGMNKQCQRCGMYLPSTELQMYRGQWYCQYCVMDLRDEHREEYEAPARREKRKVTEKPAYIEEHCDRCGRSLTVVYLFKGRKLCETCLEQEKGEAGPTVPPIAKFVLREAKRPILSPIIEPVREAGGSILLWILERLGLKKKEKRKVEIVEAVPVMKKKAGKGFSRFKTD